MTDKVLNEKVLNGRLVVGKVVSDKMEKTIVVEVERQVKHKLYGKIIRRKTKLHAHDEKQVCKIGNIVKIQESRPISKTKTWVLVEVIS
ncbi:MAG: 30S ribosomal protein S17 [Legionellales bacterium RIFCSPHIGHO2_12_FULL_35_11]|nr:MAG: 30S ribosomal protein S17 [Legionellales bacterium RIFCSPHIGHO2_12_FULL_35_11]